MSSSCLSLGKIVFLFFFQNFFFTSKKIFPLSIFYAFLDVFCHPECSKNFLPKMFFHPNFFWVKQGATQCYQAFLVFFEIVQNEFPVLNWARTGRLVKMIPIRCLGWTQLAGWISGGTTGDALNQEYRVKLADYKHSKEQGRLLVSRPRCWQVWHNLCARGGGSIIKVIRNVKQLLSSTLSWGFQDWTSMLQRQELSQRQTRLSAAPLHPRGLKTESCLTQFAGSVVHDDDPDTT